MQPTIQIYQTSNSTGTVAVTKLPEGNIDATIDQDFIDVIRNQLLPAGIEDSTESNLKSEIEDMVKLLGAFVEEGSIEKAKTVIKSIHEKLNDKSESLVRSWVRELTNLHPKIDEYIESNLPYFMNKYSEVMGTNTVMYYADTSCVDIKFWSRNPAFKNNEIEWFTESWYSPSYIRESMREKMPSAAVAYLQNASHVTSKLMSRNLTSDALTTTDANGNTVAQSRPIAPNIAHGSSLNMDWYHQAYRIMSGEDNNKAWGRDDIIEKVDEGGYLVHVLINHLNPLTDGKDVNVKDIDLPVEETFPGATIKSIVVSSNGQKISNVDAVNDDVLVPQELQQI